MIRVILFAGLVLNAGAALIGDLNSARAQGKQGVEADLARRERDWAAAVETNDPERIGAFFTDDFLFVGAGGILQDRKQHLDDFGSGRLKVTSVKLEKLTIHIYDSSAVVSSRVAVKGKFGDRDISGPYQFTDTWMKQGGGWLAVARQQTRVATPPPAKGKPGAQAVQKLDSRQQPAARKRTGTIDYQTYALANFALENMVTLPGAKLTYATRGTLNANKDNAILVPSHYSADHHGYDYLTGPGLALDPARYFIIATNMFANGLSSSPSNTPPPFDGPNFPQISIRDNVKATHELVTKEFGITRLKAVVGFSMGGQQAYQWAVSYPDALESMVVICSSARQYPFGFLRLESAKAALTTDAAWADGHYRQPPEKGLRALGLHWAPWAYSQEFWRREAHLTVQQQTFADEVKQWSENFLGSDANDLLSQAVTWQNHDIGKTPGFAGDLHKALRAIKARALLMPSTSDLYFPLADMQRESHYLPFVNFVPIQTVWGHPGGGGSDPVATEDINRVVKRFLD